MAHYDRSLPVSCYLDFFLVMIFVNLSFQYFVSCLSMKDLQLKLRPYIIVYGTVSLTITRMSDTLTQANNILSFLASKYVRLLCLSSEFD